MIKAHTPINWENEPSYNTPINETNLNKMDSTIGVLDDRIIEQDTSKLDKTTAYTMVKDISFNENNGVFTVTRLNGSTFTIDTRLEKIAINFRYDYSTQKLIVTLIDGTTQSIDMSALLTQYEFTDSNQIGWELTEDGKVKAKILNGSITEDMLQPNYLAEIKVETAKSAQYMANAKISENNAKQSELNAKASEEQALEYSNNAQPLAQSVSGNNPTATNTTNASLIYLNNNGYTQQDGTPSPDAPIRIGGLADKGYFDGQLVLSSDVLENAISNKNPFTCKAGDVIKVIYEDVVDNFSLRLIDTDGQAWPYNLSNVNEMEWAAPKDAQEVYFYIKNDTISSVADAKHITVTINGMYAVRVKTQNKNLFKCRNHAGTNLGITFDISSEKGTMTISGTNTAEWTLDIGYIELKAGNSYIISKCGNMGFAIQGLNGQSAVIDISGEKKVDVTTGCNVRVFKWFAKNGTYNGVITPMVRFANVEDDTFEPYKEPTTALIPVSAPFYDGDYIEVYADGSGREYHAMGNYVLDATKNWNKTGTNVDRYYYTYTSLGIDVDTNQYANMKCTHFTRSGSAETVGLFTSNATSIGFAFADKGTTTLTDWKNFLSNNKVHLIYPLATPTSTPLTAEQVAEFRKLRTYKGVTYITADGEVTVRYYCDNASGETAAMLQKMIQGIS